MNHSKETVLKTVAELFDLVKEKQSKVDELQKRVDNSIFILSTIDTPDEAYRSIDLLLRALKGSVNESEQALKGGSTPNLNTDENGECCHFSTTLFQNGKAECMACKSLINENREVMGKSFDRTLMRKE